jgi:hypothetical protein
VSAITIRFDVPAHFLDGRNQRAGFVLLTAFLLSFLFIRTSARLSRSPRVTWWPGSVTTESGLHLHHLVWGIVLILLSGFLGFATLPASPWNEVLAATFGIGAGFTLDEFALWIYLRDVYWEEEGRTSLEAVVVATVIGGLILLGIAPFDLPHDSASVTTVSVSVIIDVVLASLVIFKGKRLLGLVGIFIPLVSMVGVLRLATPRSPWARRFYATDGRKLARARARYDRISARRRRLADAVAGAPGVPSTAGPEAAAAVEGLEGQPGADQ